MNLIELKVGIQYDNHNLFMTECKVFLKWCQENQKMMSRDLFFALLNTFNLENGNIHPKKNLLQNSTKDWVLLKKKIMDLILDYEWQKSNAGCYTSSFNIHSSYSHINPPFKQ